MPTWVRTENAVVLNHLFDVLQNELRVRMRNDDGKPVFIANLADDMRVNVAERRDLQGLVADVVQLFRRLSKVGFVLRIVADGEALCTDDHEKFLPKVRLYAGVRGETAVHRDCDAGHKTGRVIVDEEAQCAEQLLRLAEAAIGVCEMILWLRGVRLPSSLKSKVRFWFVAKKPGAMAFTRMLQFAKCTASHCVKFETAALAPLYAGIFVSGVNAFIEEIFTMQPPVSSMSVANACVVSSVPRKFRLNTNETPSWSRSKNDRAFRPAYLLC